MGRERPYVSYLLRLWASNGRDRSWRAMVEDPRSGERQGFASPELLFDFLREQIARQTEDAMTQIRSDETDPMQRG